MLQSFSELVKSKIIYLIVGIIIFMLAFTGVDSLRMNNKNKIAKVDGIAITHQELKQELDAHLSALARSKTGDFNIDDVNIDEIKLKALNNLVEKKLLLNVANKYRMDISDYQINQSIMQIPSFRSNGDFDKEKISKILKSSGITIDKLKNMQYDDSIISQLVSGIASSEFITDFEISYFENLEFQSRNFSWLEKKAADTEMDIKISEADMQAYYAKHESTFISENKVSIEYIELKKENFIKNNDPIEATVLAQEYAYYIENWKNGARKNFNANLIELDISKYDDQLAAENVAKSIVDSLKAGGEFFKLAEEHSNDTKTAKQGGYFGLTTTLISSKPQLEEVINNLWINDSSWIQLDNKIYIIQLTTDKKIAIPELASVKDSLSQAIHLKKSEDEYIKAIRELAEVSAESPDLSEAAEYFNLEIKTTEAFSAISYKTNTNDQIISNKQIVTEAFSNNIIELKSNSDVIEINDDAAIVFRLHKLFPAKKQEFAEVKQSINQLLVVNTVKDNMQQLANNIMAKLTAGGQLVEVAQANDMQLHNNIEITRNNYGKLPIALVNKVFLMPKPVQKKLEFASVVTSGGDLMVIALRDVNIKHQGKHAVSQFRSILTSMQSQQLLSEYVDFLKSKAKININLANQ